jgi:hypothetical protein
MLESIPLLFHDLENANISLYILSNIFLLPPMKNLYRSTKDKKIAGFVVA